MGINQSWWCVLFALGMVCLVVLGASGTILFYDMTDGFGFESTEERVGFLWWFYIRGGHEVVANEIYGNNHTTLAYDYQISMGDCVPCKKVMWKTIAYIRYKRFLEGGTG
jgi:hypothetical protein